jgi:hypothetical protein
MSQEVIHDANNITVNTSNTSVNVIDSDNKSVNIINNVTNVVEVERIRLEPIFVEAPATTTVNVNQESTKIVEVHAGMIGAKGEKGDAGPPFMIYQALPDTWYTTSSIIVSSSLFVQSNTNDLFLVKNAAGANLFKVSQSGVVVIATQSQKLTGPAPYGGMYFTSDSFFVGLA